MGNMSWTSAQLAAITTNADETAVFAAAGSGKTATLTERIIRLICDPNSDTDISRMLIVTFTRAATAELKERIKLALSRAITEKKSAKLTRQLYSLPRARICTIHSFCMSVLRPHFSELSLSPSFRVLDEAESRILRKNTMHTVVGDMFEADEHANVISALADAFGAVKDDAALDESLLRLTKLLADNGITSDKAAATLKNFADKYRAADSGSFLREELSRPIHDALTRFTDYYKTVFLYCKNDMSHSEKLLEKYVPVANALLELIEKAESALSENSYSALRSIFSSIELPRLPSVPSAEQTDVSLYFKEAKNSFSSEAKKLGERFFSLSCEALDKKLAQNVDILENAAIAIDCYYNALNAEKQRINAVDYGDLEYYTAKLLRNTDGSPSAVAMTVAAGFDYAFIDEYQDTNELQDSIFSALAECGVKRFIVGDVKQSIYSFRGARPEIFTSYREPKKSSASAVFMSENFRCDPTVINFTNFVSEYMFKPTPVPIEENDLLKAGKDRSSLAPPTPVSVYLIPAPKQKASDDLTDEDGDEDGKLTEAKFVAHEVKKLISSEYLASGKKIRGGDIAILVRNPATSAKKYADELTACGVKVNESDSPDFFEQSEVLLALSVLHVINNPTNEIYLAGSMFSPVFSFDLDELTLIRMYSDEAMLWDNVTSLAELHQGGNAPEDQKHIAAKCDAFVKRVNELRQSTVSCSAASAVYRIFTELGLFRIVRNDGGKARDNIYRLYDMARHAEHASYLGLYGFLTRLDELIELGASVGKDSDKGSEADPDAVSIMSVHSSKGLEFPVCIIADTAKSFNTSDQHNSLLLDPRYGAAMRLPDETALLRLNTPLREAISEAIGKNQTEEEMRILYVAMTRAKERLIVTAALPSPDDALNRARADAAIYFSLENDVCAGDAFRRQTVYSAQNFITWILGAIMQNGTQDTFRLAIPTQLEECSAMPLDSRTAIHAVSAVSPERVDKILSRLENQYRYAYLAEIPSKLTVSKLTPSTLDENEVVLDRLDSQPTPEETESKIPEPLFISESTKASAAEKGTLTHMFLQFCSFESVAKHGITYELDRLIADEFLPPEARTDINTASLKRFADSDIFKEILTSSFVKREFRFNTMLPAKDFTGNEELKQRLNEDSVMITVQGVFDCIYRAADGALTLLDYKTDSLTREEFHDLSLAAAKLISRHENQLKNYRRIAEMIFGEPIKRTLLFSLTLGRGFEIPE